MPSSRFIIATAFREMRIIALDGEPFERDARESYPLFHLPRSRRVLHWRGGGDRRDENEWKRKEGVGREGG